MKSLTEMSDVELSDAFTAMQAEITKLQAVQTDIDMERRRRYAASQRELLEQKRTELAAFEKSLGV